MQNTTGREATEGSRDGGHLGESPPGGGQRWVAVIMHAVLPILLILYIVEALTVADYPSWSNLTSSASFSVGAAIVVALPVWFFARRQPLLRYQAIQTICWLIVVAVIAFIAGLFADALSVLVITAAAAIGGYGAFKVLSGSGFRYPGAASLVDMRRE